MQRKDTFAQGEFYHIYNRGTDKRIIFLNNFDHNRFILLLHVLNTNKNVKIRDLLRSNSFEELLSIKNENPLVAIGAYCLMPNHFHLLLTPLIENGISKFMLKLQTSYSMYFNIKNKRNGSLFQGTFKSIRIKNDKNLKYIFSYIHLNPAKLKDKDWKNKKSKNFEIIKNFILNYSYSSLREYLKNKYVIVNREIFPDYKKLYKSDNEYFKIMIDDWLNYNQEEITQGSPV
jgi:putative transposase